MEKIITELLNQNITIFQALLAFIVLLILVPIISNFVSEDLIKIFRRHIELLKYNYAKRFSPTKFQQLILGTYFEKLIKSDLFKISIPTYDDYITKNLKDVFIPLKLIDPKNNKAEIIQGNNLREQNNYALIIGEPGGGKTTLVKSILFDIIENSLTHKKIEKIPVFVPLKEIQPKSHNTDSSPIESYIHKYLETFGIPSLTDIYNKAVNSFGCIFVFDGMDEISNQTYKQIEKDLLAFIRDINKKSEKNEVYITAREQFYQSDIFDRREFNIVFSQIATIIPFTDDDLYQFLRKWNDYKTGQSPSQLFTELIIRPHVLEICRNPLLLSILTAQYSSRAYFEIPESRSAFYNAITKELLYRRRDFKDAIRTRKHIVEERSKFLKQIAFNNLFSQVARNSFSKEELIAIIDDSIAEKEEFLNDLCIDTGLLKKESPEKYTFMHLSFAEFYAAEYVEEKITWEFLFDKYLYSDQRLEEVIIFFVGQSKKEATINKALNDLFQKNKIDLLLKCLIEKKHYKNPIFQKVVAHILTDLKNILEPETRLREITFINFISVIFDSKERTGSYPKEFEQKLVELAEKDEKYLTDILYLVGRYDFNLMLSIYEVFGDKYLYQFIQVLRMSVSDDRIIDSIIRWYREEKDSFIAKDDLVLILIAGMKFPATRAILSEQKLLTIEPDMDTYFALPNCHQDSSLTSIFNLGIHTYEVKGNQEISEELYLASQIKKDKQLLKQWNSFFEKSNNISKDNIDFFIRLANQNIFFFLSFMTGIVSYSVFLSFYVIYIIILLDNRASFPVQFFAQTLFNNFLIYSSLSLIAILGCFFFCFFYLSNAISKIELPADFSFNLKTIVTSKFLLLLIRPIIGVLKPFWILDNIKKFIPKFKATKLRLLFRKLEKLELKTPLSNMWFFDV